MGCLASKPEGQASVFRFTLDRDERGPLFIASDFDGVDFRNDWSVGHMIPPMRNGKS